jgi:hypothetical protein
MTYINGINLLPGTGEFTYDTVAHLGQRPATETSAVPINVYASGASASSYAGEPTDFIRAIDNLQAEFPDCTTISLIVSWFFDSITARFCKVFPSTTYINGNFSYWTGSRWEADGWKVSGLTQSTPGVIPISSSGGKFNYGGTPSDSSVYNAIVELKSRGLRVVFYPFLLGDIPGSFPWRGRITYSPDRNADGIPIGADKTTDAETSVAHFLGGCQVGDFSIVGGEVVYAPSGDRTLLDFSYRRMILHYANLCVMADGVDLFIIGSELVGLESIRGTDWTKAGLGNPTTWDYPFVNGMITLADDVRSVFDSAGLTKNLTTKKNLVSYAADWSTWMGVSHGQANPPDEGQWPHLDQLWAQSNIDLVCFDNYLPISDWTIGAGGRDVSNWSVPKYSGSWPPDETQMNGLGLTGSPRLLSKDYLKANIEGGEKFNWYYAGPDRNLGLGLDLNGSAEQVSRPEGDRLAQVRTRYYADQEILANKQIRWWWKNTHQAIYPIAPEGWSPRGNPTKWAAQTKSIAFSEYGFPSCDKATNQPNVFFDPKSEESFTPYWSEWKSAFGGIYLPKEDSVIAALALQAVHEYWFVDGNNDVSVSGAVMLDQAFCSVWAWDARPFPIFPQFSRVWGDAANWASGHWVGGKERFIEPPHWDPSPESGAWPAFPILSGQGWSVIYRPTTSPIKAQHVSGRESRAVRTSSGLLEIEITFDVMRMDNPAEIELLAGFYADRAGAHEPFTYFLPTALALGTSITARFIDDHLGVEEFALRLWRGESVKIAQTRGE